MTQRLVPGCLLALCGWATGCGGGRAVVVPGHAPTARETAAAPEAEALALPPLVAISDPVEPSSTTSPSQLATAVYVQNELDAAWLDGSPTAASVARLAETDGLTSAQLELLVAAPAKLREMGVAPKRCQLMRWREGAIFVSCFEPQGTTRCTERARTSILRVGTDALKVVEDAVGTAPINRADGSCGCVRSL